MTEKSRKKTNIIEELLFDVVLGGEQDPMGTAQPDETPIFLRTSTAYYPPVRITDLENQVRILTFRVGDLVRLVKEMHVEIFDKPNFTSLTISDLGSNLLKVAIPISVIIEETDEEALARWPEVNAYGLGATLHEALEYLKTDIQDLYTDINSRDPNTLGDVAIKTKNILDKYIERKE